MADLRQFHSLVHCHRWDLRSHPDRIQCLRLVAVAAVVVVIVAVLIVAVALKHYAVDYCTLSPPPHPGNPPDDAVVLEHVGDENVGPDCGAAAMKWAAVAIETVWRDDRYREAVERYAGDTIHVIECPPDQFERREEEENKKNNE